MKYGGKELSERKLQEREAQACDVQVVFFGLLKKRFAYTGEGDIKIFQHPPPHKKHPRSKVKTDIDDFNKCKFDELFTTVTAQKTDIKSYFKDFEKTN